MIVSRDQMPRRPIEIDLSGPDGNAYALMGYARTLGRQLAEEKIKAIIKADAHKLRWTAGNIRRAVWRICEYYINEKL